MEIILFIVVAVILHYLGFYRAIKRFILPRDDDEPKRR